jgi:hypothetical protein
MIFINEHEVVLDAEGRLESWTSFDHVIRLAMDFIKNCPVDAANGLPWHLQYSCFWTDPVRPTDWPDNPAGKFAWAVTTLLKYYPYSGDTTHIGIVRGMLDRLWQYRTPSHWEWPDVPYASAHPGTGVYFGARADGEYVTEPDKVAQVAKAYLDFYELTGEQSYLEIGARCAEVLAAKVRPGDESHSPWPFRVDVRDGHVVEEYTAHWVPAVELFDELIRLNHGSYGQLRNEIWAWLEAYPLRNSLWKGHFEDIRLDPANANRDQLSPMETARYVLRHANQFPDWQERVRGLLEWVRAALGGQPFFSAIPIHEQKFCYFPMGSHTARFASVAARFAALGGDRAYAEIARRSFNWASYMANPDGTVTVGVDRPDYYNQCWFTDGYFDYLPHFIDGMAAAPELAPASTDHMLESTSVVQEISYQPCEISYRTFDSTGRQKLRLTFPPYEILADGRPLDPQDSTTGGRAWEFDPALNVLIVRPGSRHVTIAGRQGSAAHVARKEAAIAG